MLTEIDITQFINKINDKIKDCISTETITVTRMINHLASIFLIVGTIKEEGKYLICGHTIGMLSQQLRELPTDFKYINDLDKKQIKEILKDIREKLTGFASNIQNLDGNPMLEVFALLTEKVSDFGELLSIKLPKFPLPP